MNSPLILPGQPQVIAKELQVTLDQAIPMLFNAVQQLNAGMQNFHERITALEIASNTGKDLDAVNSVRPKVLQEA